jgi:hypothetical protein
MQLMIRLVATGHDASAAQQQLAGLLAGRPELGEPLAQGGGIVWERPGRPPIHVATALFAAA